MRKNTIIEHRDEDGNVVFVYQFDAKGIEVLYYREPGRSDFVSWEELFDENRHWHGTEDRECE